MSIRLNEQLKSFHDGNSREAYSFMGAHKIKIGNETGYVFRVWAPRAQRVSVVGDFNFWNTEDLIMNKSDKGVWTVFSKYAKAGGRYKYFIRTADGRGIYKSDPYAFHTETRPNTASKFYGLPDFKWTDKSWMKKRKARDVYASPVNIYEVHAGSWQTYEDGNPLPYLDGVAITFIIDKQTVFLEFIKGNLDFMNSLDASYKDELLTQTGQLRTKYSNKINMHSQPYLNTEYLGFLMENDNSPIKDKRIRQAINYGFDRRKMMKYLRNNVGIPGCYGFIPKGLPGFDTSMVCYEYDSQMALQLLADAGYPNGKGLPTIKLSTTATYLDLCKYIQQQLSIIGINIDVDVNPPGALREQIAQSKSNWFRGSWIADYPDAENYLSLFYSDNFCPKGPNYTHYSNAKFDKLYSQAKATTCDSTRVELYKKMNKLIMDEAPVVVLYYDQILHFTHKNIAGLQSNAMNSLNLKHVIKR